MHKKLVVVFDFDGVLTVGGEGLKQKAWDILALPLHQENANLLYKKREEFSGGKGSRNDILRETFAEFYPPYNVGLLTAGYADCYNTIVHKLLEQSGMPEGTEQTLATLAKFCTLFVNSATPEKAVRESVQNFNIVQHFRGIFGQPISKVDNLARAQHLTQVDREFILFVGDSDGDAKAAKEFGCDFVGVANDWNKWTKETVKFPLVGSIAELPKLLET
ncbi:MAG: phosphatase [Parcubacteria group bacterium Gr01-1014_17]|nr:MAG: phosphatase [Parcubacteria group bacterium Gr01-1014_17]